VQTRHDGGGEIPRDAAFVAPGHARRVGAFDVTTYCALPYGQVRRVWVTDSANRVVLDAWVRARGPHSS